MIFFDADDATLDKKVHSFCAPLFGTDRFMQDGHDSAKTSATATFVQFQGRIYAVTCHHVIAAFQSSAHRTGKKIVPSVHQGRSIQTFGHQTAGAYRYSFASCREFPDAKTMANDDAMERLRLANTSRPDIAIADLTEVWESFRANRSLTAINLDDWTEPEWASVQETWLAYGFPDAHKYLTGQIVAAPMPRIAAALATSVPSPDKPTFTLCSTLENEHGWGFSGISGGPVLVAHTTEDRYAFVGIVFEGAPSSADIVASSEAFIEPNDIVLHGYHVTPKIFSHWLTQLKFGVELT